MIEAKLTLLRCCDTCENAPGYSIHTLPEERPVWAISETQALSLQFEMKRIRTEKHSIRIDLNPFLANQIYHIHDLPSGFEICI